MVGEHGGEAGRSALQHIGRGGGAPAAQLVILPLRVQLGVRLVQLQLQVGVQRIYIRHFFAGARIERPRSRQLNKVGPGGLKAARRGLLHPAEGLHDLGLQVADLEALARCRVHQIFVELAERLGRRSQVGLVLVCAHAGLQGLA
jgi:hypothetical protein